MTTKAPGVYSPDGSHYVTMTDGAGNLVSASQPLVGASGNPINETAIGSSNFLNVIPPDAGNTTTGWGGPFSATSASTLFSVDTTGFSSITVQITSAGTTCTITYEESNDGQTWAGVPGNFIGTNASSVPVISTTATTTIMFPACSRYFRARISTYTSGTVTVWYALRQNWAVPNLPISLNGGVVSLTSSTSGGASYAHIAGGATANTVVKASAGTLYSILINSQPVSGSVMTIFDNTTAQGTTIGIFTAVASEIPPYTMNYGAVGLAFATGLSINVATQNCGDMTVIFK